MRAKFYLTACSVLLCLFKISAQDFSNKGKDFWIGYGNHVRMFNSGAAEKMQLYITSDVSTSGEVNITSIGFNQSFSVTANQITTIDIPRSAALTDHGLFNHGIHVTSEKPIVVYSFIYVNAISGATVCLPTATLGKDYYSVNFSQVSNELNSHSYFFVVAADTGTTTVEITPSQPTKAGQPAGVPFNVSLTQGQIYQVLGTVSGTTGVDLTGSKIRSISTTSTGCKKIAVFCGSGKIKIGNSCGNANTSDNLYQQMYPASTWGKKYITVPGRVNQRNYFRVVKSDASTVVRLNGVEITPVSFTNSFYYEFASSQTNVIEGDKPILVAQYFTTQNCEGNPAPGDPDMIYLNPVEQTIDNVTLNSMQPATGTNIAQHYLNVVLKNDPAAINSFKIDGALYAAFSPVPTDPAYAYAQITTSAGTHKVSCDTGFNIISYGFGNAESYGYSGGTNLRDLYQFVSVQNQYATVNFPAACKTSPFYFTMTFPYQPTQIQWRFNGLFPDVTINAPVYDSTWVINGRQLYRYKLPNTYTINAVGTYPIRVIVLNPTTDGCSGEQEINYDLQIFDRPMAAFNFSGSGCLTDSISFLDNTNTGERSAIKWNWEFGNGNTSSVKNPQHLYTSAGSFTVSHSVITDIGCVSDTASRTIKIEELPVAEFSTEGAFCINKDISFKDLSSSKSGAITKWTWNFGNGVNVVKTNNSPFTHRYATAGTYNITLQVETQACSSKMFSKKINVTSVPVAGFILPVNCIADPFSQFKDSSRIADGTQAEFQYLWNFGNVNADATNSNTSTIQNPRHKYTAVGNYNVSLKVTSNNGCTDSVSKVFTINGALPQASFTIQGGNEQCSNNQINITNNSSVDFGKIVKLEIYWDYTNDPTNKTIDEDPTQGKKYTRSFTEFHSPAAKNQTVQVVAYSGENCLSTTSQVLQLKATPEIEFSEVSAVCPNVPAFQLKQAKEVSGMAGTGIFSGKGVSSSGLFNPQTAGAGIHAIRYTFTATNSCVNYKEQSIKVYPLVKADAGPDRSFLEGGSVGLLGSGTGNNITYLWTLPATLNNATIPQPVASPTSDITYTLKVRSADGCESTDDVFVKMLKAPAIPNTFSPNGDGVHDRWDIAYLESYPGATVQVFNRYGQLVFESKGYTKPWDGTYKGKPLPIGTYYYLIDPKNGRNKMSGFVDIIR
jgi:gliding motility-associated-like protein